MGSSHVLVTQGSVNPYLTPSRHTSKKEGFGISVKPSQLKPPPTSFRVVDTSGNKKSVRYPFYSRTDSLYLDERVATTQVHLTFAHENGGEELFQGGQREGDLDNFRVSCLIRKLASLGDLEKINVVFGRLLKPDAYVWSAVISAYSNLGHFAQAIDLYYQMINSRTAPDGHVFVAVLRAYSSLLDLEQGMNIHACVLKSGLDSDVFISNTLVAMYAKCGKLEDAQMIFNKLMHLRDVVTWSTLIQAYTEHGHPLDAYDLFQQMQQEGIQLNEFTFVCLLKACSKTGDIEYGQKIHSLVIENGFESDLFVGNTLMDMYIKCDSLDIACVHMNKLLKRDVVTWSIIIGGYAERQYFFETLQAFQQMKENGAKPDHITYVCLTKACQSLEALEQGRHVHSLIIESGLESDHLVGSAVVDMYVKCENLEDAHAVFDRLSKQNVSIWDALIRGYCQFGHSRKAYQIVQLMEQEGLDVDIVTLISLVSACSCSGDLEQGKQVHCHLVEFGIQLNNAIGNSLIDMYSKCGSFEDACVLFNQLAEHDVVTWNIMIAWHAQNNHGKEAMIYFERMQEEGFIPDQVTWNAMIASQSYPGLAIEFFWQMQQVGVAPDKVTFVCILQTCCKNGSLEQGMELHKHTVMRGFDVDMLIQNTLIDLYARNDSLEAACIVFDKIRRRDAVTWNILISGHTMHGHAPESLKLYQRMPQENVDPDRATFVAVLQACSSITLLEHGKQIHDQITERGFELDLHVGNTLIDFYAKCGTMEDAHFVFNRLPERDEVTWSTLISGHSKHCDYVLASQCFRDMQDEGLKPNAGVYLSLLSACSHASLLNEGCFYFKSMQQGYGIIPTPEHYVVLIELFGKGGCLKEAEELLEILPSGSNTVGWTSLLGSCKKYGFVDLAKQCFEHLITMRSESSSGYVLMSSIYADAGMGEAAKEVAILRKRADVWKQPAKAYIEIDNQVHDFAVGDATHPRSEEIYAELGRLNTQLKHDGYSPCVNLAQEGSSAELQEKSLWAHSEKLALAFGLLCTPEGTTIRVAKNLRVCADCHEVARSISKMERRDIIIKDTHCIHHFKDGACCCNDYE
eukprot:c17301_g1_i1 orf=537-3779(-)